MATEFRAVVVAGFITLLLGAAGCDRSPTNPGGDGPGSISRIEIVSSSVIAPGESRQLTLNAIRADGSVENITAGAQWTSENSAVLQLSGAGPRGRPGSGGIAGDRSA